MEKGIPAVKAKGAELFNTAREALVTKEPAKAGKKQTGRAIKQSSEIAAVPVRSKSRTVVHSPEEFD